MPHPRQDIREAAKAQLVAANTAAADRVTETRVVPHKRPKLPAIAVYMLAETVDPASWATAPRELKRFADLAIEGAAQQAEDVDDALDALALQIEAAIHKDETLGGKCSDCVLASTEVDVLEEGQQLIGVVRLNYRVTYYTDAPAISDQAALDDLRTANIRHNVGGNLPAGNEAVDQLENLDQ
jgi:hypothetical protein